MLKYAVVEMAVAPMPECKSMMLPKKKEMLFLMHC